MASRFNRVAAGALVVAAIVGGLKVDEGFSAPPYRDQAGVWTNGYGNTVGVTAKTPPITPQQAEALLVKQVDEWMLAVDSALTVSAGENQTAAFVSLTHNIGKTAFRNSTVVRRWNAGDFIGACRAILMWDKITVGGRKVVNRGLQLRRKREQAQCLIGL